MHHMVHGSANILLRNMFYYVYVLKSIKDSKLYIGYTEDLKKRIKEHWGGKVLSTKTRMPVELVFYEAYRNKYDALRREKYLKTSKGKSTLKNMLREFFKKD
ncbi:MAG: GIY-YIG nuclease family protein [Nitrospirota bacterium]|jgi:putative endonuclease